MKGLLEGPDGALNDDAVKQRVCFSICDNAIYVTPDTFPRQSRGRRNRWSIAHYARVIHRLFASIAIIRQCTCRPDGNE